MKMQIMIARPIVLTLLLLFILAGNHLCCNVRSVDKEWTCNNSVDSVVIYYRRNMGGYLSEQHDYRDIMMGAQHKETGFGSLSVNDSIGVNSISSAIDSLKKLKYSDVDAIVDAYFTILAYRCNSVDTIALGYSPGIVQTRETKYADKFSEDSILWFTIIEIISDKDPLWITSYDGETCLCHYTLER